VTILLNIGSNLDREHHIVCGLNELERHFSLLRISSVYESLADGFDGPPFYNLAVEAECTIALMDLCQQLREIEYAYGRPLDASKNTSRKLDIDLLTFNDLSGVFALPLSPESLTVTLPRPDILTRSYVLAPLAEMLPERILPDTELSYFDLWQASRDSMSEIDTVAFSWSHHTLPWSAETTNCLALT